jgi:hypothetical protein
VFPGIPLFSDQVDGAHAIGSDCETNIGVVGRQRSAWKGCSIARDGYLRIE